MKAMIVSIHSEYDGGQISNPLDVDRMSPGKMSVLLEALAGQRSKLTDHLLRFLRL